MPISMFLLDFFEKYDLCDPDERCDFEFKHWRYMLTWLRGHIDKIDPLTKKGIAYVQPFPYSKEQLDKFKLEEKEPPKQDKLTFDQALAVLEGVLDTVIEEKKKDRSEKLKRKWTDAFHGTFRMMF